MAGRGGARVRSGPPKKPLKERLEEGNVSHRPLKVIKFSEKAVKDDDKTPPKISKKLTEAQACGIKLHVKEVFDAAWKWIDERGCSELIAPQLLERYAMASARWIQCERALSKFGLLGEHPTTGGTTQSPYAVLGDRYLSQANRLWSEIFAIIRENSLADYSGKTPREDVMESLLQKPKKEKVI